MKGGYGPRAVRRRDSCAVRNRLTRMSAARLWEGLAPALNYHYTDTSKAFFAALPFAAGVEVDEGAHEVVDGGRDANKDEKISHGGGSFPGGFGLLLR